MKQRMIASLCTYSRNGLACLVAALALTAPRTGAFPVITNVVETGGDGTILAQFTGQTFTGPTIGTYTVPFFKVLAKCFDDRLHAYTNCSATVSIPSYLLGNEYVMTRNDNRENTGFQMVVSVASGVRAYLLIDNRIGDGANGNPPALGAAAMPWVLNEGWAPVLNGLNRTGNTSVPDEVGIDEGADGGINNWFSVYSKVFPAGSFVVKAQGLAGNNMYGLVVAVANPPPTPTNVVALSGDNKVTLSWNSSPGASAYVIKRADLIGDSYAIIATNTTATYLDTAVINDQTYYYVVSALNAVGESANSAEVIGAPKAAPQNLAATGGTNQIQLVWSDFPGAASYTVYGASAAAGPYLIVVSNVAAATYTDTAVLPGSTYYYKVLANLSAGGESGATDPVSGTTAPSAPSLQSSVLAVTVVKLAWTTTNPVVSSFLIEKSTDGVTFAPLAAMPGTARSYLDTGLAPSTPNYYRVQAANTAGYSDYSVVVSNTTPSGGWNVNFANFSFATNFPGYVNDYGTNFTVQPNGWSYGWDVDNVANARERNNSLSADKRYDTFTHLQKQVPSRVWEIEIPNGFYQVHIAAGESDNTDSTFQFLIEQVVTPAKAATTTNRWQEFTHTCIVGDGRLTISSGPLAANNKIDFIDIYPAIPLPIVIGANPQPAEVVQNRTATFGVTIASGSEPFYYQWYSPTGEVAGATNSALVLALPQPADAGDYYVVITNYYGAVTSTAAGLVVTADTTPPQIVSVGSVDGTSIGVRFDELVDPGSAVDTVAYSFKDGLGNAIDVSPGTLRADGRSVVFPVAGTPLTGQFTVQANEVRDLTLVNYGPTAEVPGSVFGLAQNLGYPLTPGHNYGDGSIIELSGGGYDIWGTYDEGYLAYKSVSGDFDARVRVDSLTLASLLTGGDIAKAGLMVRSSIESNSPTLHLLANPPTPGRNLVQAGQRTTVGGGTANWGTNQPVAASNLWVRLTRSGNDFAGYWGTNSSDWTLFATTNQTLPLNTLVGLAVSSHTNGIGLMVTGVYSGFSLIQQTTDLAISKVSQPSAVLVGGTVTNLITVTNQGPDNATLVTVTDLLPAGLTYVSGVPSQGTVSQAGGVVTANLGTLNAGASATIAIVIAGPTAGTYPNTATVSSGAHEADLANNSAGTVITVFVAPSINTGSLTYSGSGDGASFGGTLQTVAGVTYLVEYKNSFADPQWTELTTIIGNGSAMPFSDPGPLPNPGSRFYRIRVVTP